MLKISK